MEGITKIGNRYRIDHIAISPTVGMFYCKRMVSNQATLMIVVLNSTL